MARARAQAARPRDARDVPGACSGLVGLVKEYPDDESLLEELRTQVRNAEAMAVAIFNQAAKALPDGGPPTDRPLNPYALSLDPQRWEADGLFEAPGITIEQARAAIVGLDGLWDSSLALAGGPPPGVGGGPPPGVAGGPPLGAGGPPPGVAG